MMIARLCNAQLIILTVSVTVWISCTGGVSGGIVEYGKRAGAHVNFMQIQEISQDWESLFGLPQTSGDMLMFPGHGFISEAINNQVDFVQGRLEMTIEAHDGFLINQVDVSEFGAFFAFGDNATTMAQGVGFVVADGEVHNANLLFENDGPGQGDWARDLTIEFPATSSVRFVLDNQLLTFAEEMESAFIDKVGIHVGVGTIAVAVPEPTTANLAMLSLLAFCSVSRIRRRKRHIEKTFS